MYSTKLKNNRYIVRCIRMAENTKVVRFIIDTGAQYSCANYSLIDDTMKEEDCYGCDTKIIRGVIEGDSVRLYKYRLKQFTIGNINMGEQDIWVTFDRRVTDTVLGMDILKQIIMITNPYNQQVYFCKDSDEYNSGFELLTI